MLAGNENILRHVGKELNTDNDKNHRALLLSHQVSRTTDPARLVKSRARPEGPPPHVGAMRVDDGGSEAGGVARRRASHSCPAVRQTGGRLPLSRGGKRTRPAMARKRRQGRTLRGEQGRQTQEEIYTHGGMGISCRKR